MLKTKSRASLPSVADYPLGTIWLSCGPTIYRWEPAASRIESLISIPDDSRVIFSAVQNLAIVLRNETVELWNLSDAQRIRVLPINGARSLLFDRCRKDCPF